MTEAGNIAKKIFNFFKNRYVIVTIIFILLMLFSSNSNIFYFKDLSKQRKELREKKAYYENEIRRDSLNTIRLQKNVKEIERYGREKYMMKKENEDVYIIKPSSQDNKMQDASKKEK
ncbi:MAG: hypothetical protein IJ748_06505 [Bacteroidales bacterium]|nr:hypothetical protein [Bacteroidales bacterium]